MFEMAARFRLDGLVGLSRGGNRPMSRNSSRISSVIRISPWKSSYPSDKGEKLDHRLFSNELASVFLT